MKRVLQLSCLAIAMSFASCSEDNDNNGDDITVTTKAEVMTNYAAIVYQSYLDSYNGAVTLQSAVTIFIDTPNETNFEAAKTAWLDARDIYGQTEAYRECNGPVDTENESWSLGNEGQLNAWPIDESYIDYVFAGTEAYAGSYFSIISDTSITINEVTLASLNEDDTDKSISTGWHAVEFLLWGQDNTLPSEDLPGQRLYTDYTTADNADRRGAYLQAATDLLVSDLNDLVITWASGGAYRTVFEALDEDIALKQLINGAFFIAGDELSSERMLVAVNNTDGIGGTGQEDEHSCFSDNTHNDVWANAQGVYNVIFGSYGSISGGSFYDLVLETDPTQAVLLKAAADTAMEKVNLVRNDTKPFDELIGLESISNPGIVLEAASALEDWSDEITASATSIGINL